MHTVANYQMTIDPVQLIHTHYALHITPPPGRLMDFPSYRLGKGV